MAEQTKGRKITAKANSKELASVMNTADAFFAVETPTAAPTPDNGEVVKGSIVTWGKDNDYPQQILSLFDRCSTFQSIVEGTADYIAGNGLTEINPAIELFAKRVNDDGDDLFDVVDKTGWNTEIYGGAAILITRSMDKRTVAGVNVLDARRVRCKPDGTGIIYLDIKNGKLLNTGPTYQFWTGLQTVDDTADHLEVYFWRGRRPRGYYPRPRYASAFQAIDTQVRIQEYYSSLVRNQFTLCGILTVPADGISAENQKDFHKRLNETYSGSTKAGRLMVQFVSSSNLKAEYTSISANDLDKQYIEVSKSTRENIYAAFRAIPALFGIMTETTGFSQQEFSDAFNLYSVTVISPRQRDIVRIFSDIFGIDKPFQIIPFNFTNTATNAEQ